MQKIKIPAVVWGLLIALAFATLVSLILYFGGFRTLELKTLDARYKLRGPRDVSHSNLIIIAIDRQTFKACRDRYPYPREYYANLIENLNEVGIKQVVFDIQFTEPDMKNPQGDEILARSIEQAGNVLLAGTVAREMTRGGMYVYADKPLPVLLETGCEWGVVGEIQDADGFTRRYSLFEQVKAQRIYSLGTKVFLFASGLPMKADFTFKNGYFIFSDSSESHKEKIQAFRGRRGHEQTILINYYGPAKTFPTYSLSSVLDDAEFNLKEDEDSDYLEIFKRNSNYPYELRIALLSDSTHQAQAFTALALGDTQQVEQIIDQENPFKDKIALVGVSLLELHDNKYTPFYNFKGQSLLMPGVETHAHAIQTMLDGKFIKKTSLTTDIIILFVLSVITGLLVFYTSPIIGGLITILLGVCTVALTFWLFIQHNLWIYLTPLITGIVVSYIGDVVYQFLSEQREKKKIRGMFSTYMSPKVLKYLEDHPDAFSLKGEKREATMFFSDVQGFTTISESLSAEELSLVLNKYLSPMTDILMSYDGYVDKYEGDAIMCDFGVPMEDPNHAWRACYAALDQQERLKTLRKEIKADHGVDIYVRMGINSGVVSAGNMGSAQRFQYTVMGDAVNQASRFEGANKQYGTYLMIGEETYKQAKEKLEVRVLDKLVVKGKLIPITVYELLAKKGELTDELQTIREYFTKGIESYWQKDWTAAIKYFEQAIAVNDSDPPSETFIKRCHIYQENPPGDDWQGEFIMTTK